MFPHARPLKGSADSRILISKIDLEDGLCDKTRNEKLRDYKVFFPDKGRIWRYIDDFAFISGCNHTVILRYALIWTEYIMF